MTDRPRLRRLAHEELDADQRALYRTITGGARAADERLVPLIDGDGGLQGPFNAMLLAPALGGALQAVGAAIRYSSALSPRIREMAILMVAAHWGSGHEREAHEAVGRAVGLTDAELATLRRGQLPLLEVATEAMSLAVVRSLITSGSVGDDEYASATEQVGTRALFELSTLVGYYTTLALQLRLFGVDTPGQQP